jgi:cell division FtsZ-interacting protein ZapD
MAFYKRSPVEKDHFPAEIETLLAAYRSSLPETDASVDFMPKLWERIEGQQRVTYSFRKFASGFVTVAAAMCLMLSVAVQSSQSHMTTARSGSYVDVLADDTVEMTAVEAAPAK